MSHPLPHHPEQNPSRSARRAFTLIEVLVVVGILVLLIAIALPMLSSARKNAAKTRQASDLQAITTGLEAFKTDHGDYPRPEQNLIGFAALTRALIAPGPAGGPLPAVSGPTYPAGTVAFTGTAGQPNYAEWVAFGRPDPSGGFSATVAPPDATQWGSIAVSDAKDGPGFKVRAGGKAYGPYLQPEKFRLRGMAILDLWGNPILYFPARPVKPAMNTAGSATWPLLTGGPALYNAGDNISFFLRGNETVAADSPKALKRVEGVIVQTPKTYDGLVENGEQPATTGPFLLWSAGVDGTFGVTYAGANPTAEEIRKVDDVTNFTTGQ
jgi:prepilin-type N-terminal cleavage/methylation domain-containing protein